MIRGHEDWRTRGPEIDRAKMQIGAELLCKSAKVGYKSIEYGVLSMGRGTIPGWRDDAKLKGRPETGELAGDTFSGVG